jgi:hypothetical protein
VELYLKFELYKEVEEGPLPLPSLQDLYICVIDTTIPTPNYSNLFQPNHNEPTTT